MLIFKLMNQKKKLFFVISIILLVFYFLPSVTNADTCDIVTLLGCVVDVTDWIKSIVIYLFIFTGIVFDNLLHIGLSTNLFQQDFIKIAWSNIRDLANMIFILVVIYIAFMMLLNKGDWKKTLVYLILVIFVINFSLFFSRIIVDAGNITARVFLTAISVPVSEPSAFFGERFYITETIIGGRPENGYHSVTLNFAKKLEPKGILDVRKFENWLITPEGTEKDTTTLRLNYILLNMFLIIIFFMVGIEFLKGGFMFLGRLIWITYYMISSPIWFLSLLAPQPQINKKWLSNWFIPLLSKSFCMVIYFFMIWLTLILLNADSTNISDVSFGGALVVFGIKGIFVYVLLQKTNKFGHKLCEGEKSTWDKGISTLKNVASFPRRILKKVTDSRLNPMRKNLHRREKFREWKKGEKEQLKYKSKYESKQGKYTAKIKKKYGMTEEDSSSGKRRGSLNIPKTENVESSHFNRGDGLLGHIKNREEQTKNSPIYTPPQFKHKPKEVKKSRNKTTSIKKK